jgi:hypothetical protein
MKGMIIMKINTTNTTNKNKKRVAITTIICAMVIFAMVVVGCGIKKNSTVAEAEGEIIAEVGATIDTTEIVADTTEIVEDTTETIAMGDTTETVEEPTTEVVEEEPSVETPSEDKPSNTTTETETPSENKPSETPSTPSTTETPSQPTTSEPTTTTPTTEEPTPQPTPNVEKHWCGTPMQMMSGYIFHPAEGYYAPYVHFSNGEEIPYGDGTWINAYMTDNGITSYSLVENHWVETAPAWREENVTQMCCPSCRYADNGFVAY